MVETPGGPNENGSKRLLGVGILLFAPPHYQQAIPFVHLPVPQFFHSKIDMMRNAQDKGNLAIVRVNEILFVMPGMPHLPPVTLTLVTL